MLLCDFELRSYGGGLLEDHLALVGLLLAEELAERAIPAGLPVQSLLSPLWAIGVVDVLSLAPMDWLEVARVGIGCVLLLLSGIWHVHTVFVDLLDVLSLDVELTELPEIIDQVVRNPNTLLRLIKGVLMSMHLREDSAVLKFQFAD
jgi:hypothetical protein